MRIPALFYALSMAVMALPAAAQTGVWLPTQIPANGIGSWWELRADGSTIRYWGALAEAHYRFDGTYLTVIPGGDRKDRPRFRLRFDRDRMYSRADQTDAPEVEYRRVGPTVSNSPLIGQWASVAVPKTGKPAMPGMTGPTDLAAINGDSISILRSFAPRESVYAVLHGYNDSSADYDIRLENHLTGAGVHITADRPFSRLVYWGSIHTLCPEPYIHVSVAPGETFTWTLRYEFYTLNTRP